MRRAPPRRLPSRRNYVSGHVSDETLRALDAEVLRLGVNRAVILRWALQRWLHLDTPGANGPPKEAAS